MESLRTLLHGIIDYAGLFPPAGLEIGPAVAEYAEHYAGPHRWALGRFVLPTARLPDFASAADPCLPRGGEPWRLSALVGTDLPADLGMIRHFNDAHRGRALVDAVEFKAASPRAVGDALDIVGTWLESYVELPLDVELGPLMRAVGERGARVKVRTGGVTADAFPTPRDLIRFIRAAARARVAFKATAGLHHPLCGGYPLTYAPDSGRAVMYGFLNLFLAAGFAGGLDDAAVIALLTEASPAAFRFSDHGVEWRGRSLSNAELARSRRDVATSFGSCSFREPIADLQSLGLL
ncbi:MAG TPA: hypothetical protein VFM14_00985 [Gemmatimonadales bacterium]|nr:hypothetical protein [Gemmatimonadales bacterium]